MSRLAFLLLRCSSFARLGGIRLFGQEHAAILPRGGTGDAGVEHEADGRPAYVSASSQCGVWGRCALTFPSGQTIYVHRQNEPTQAAPLT